MERSLSESFAVLEILRRSLLEYFIIRVSRKYSIQGTKSSTFLDTVSRRKTSCENNARDERGVNHESLLQTIKKYFPEQIHHLLKSYQSNRTFVEKIKDVYSEAKDIRTGISRGSVSGPILYTLYTADVSTTNSKILTFADDTAVLVKHANPETAVTLLQEHVTKIEKRLQDKQIKANLSKGKHILFTLRKRKPSNVQLNGTHNI